MKPFSSRFKGKGASKNFQNELIPEDQHKIANRFFDVEFYREQLDEGSDKDQDLLSHYLQTGWKLGHNPCPLFNTTYYLSTYSDVASAGVNPFLHYLMFGKDEGRQFHPLFDVAHYKCQIPDASEKERNWLAHFLEFGNAKGLSPHPLFNSDYYREQITSPSQVRLRNKAASISKPKRAAVLPKNLFLHYLTIGWKSGFNASPLFDGDWYQKANQIVLPKGVDPLSHYLAVGFQGSAVFHPAFDVKFYELQGNLESGKNNPLLHFFRALPELRINPNRFFDPQYYLEHNEDIKRHNICPFVHFVAHGCSEETRNANRLATRSYVYSQNTDESFAKTGAYTYYFKERYLRRKTRLIFIGHEATRTGAPLILLELMRYAANAGIFDVFLILKRGGDLEGDFKALAHTVVMRDSDTADSLTDYFMGLLGNDPPIAVIANSIESRDIANAFGAYGIKSTLLVHEMMDVYYDPSESQDDLVNISKIIFPAEFVRDGFLRYLSFPQEKTNVLPQGLLDPRFGRGLDRAYVREKLFENMAIPTDAFVVVACGTVDFRKGTDYFLHVAKQVIAKASADESVYFVWVGKISSFEFHSIYYWLQYEIKKLSLEHRIKFSGETTEVEDYFVAADLFLLTSRADPFPCVCHEAMAAKLPIIAFEESGGMPDAIRDGAGMVVPFGDVSSMADAVLELSRDSKKREAIVSRAEMLVRNQYRFDRYAQDVLRFTEAVPASVELPSEKRMSAGAPIKVFFSACDWEISGVNTQVIHLLEGLNKRGFDAKILFTRGRYTYFTGDKLQLPDLPSIFLQPESEGHWDVWKVTREFLEKQAPCIYVPNYDYVVSAICPGLHNRVAVVGMVHSDDIEHYEHVHRLGAYWNRIVAVSEQVVDGIRDLNASFLDKTTMIPYGIPVRSMAPRGVRKFSKDNPIRLVYLGRFVRRQKRIYDYAALAQELDARDVPFKLTLAGDGEETAEVARRLGALVQAGKVELPGRLSPVEVQSLLSESDVILMLSDFEGLPLALLEAMERGCIPVAYDIKSGIPMAVKHGKNGFIVSHGRIDKVADAIENLVGNPELVARMSAEIRTGFTGSQFTEDAMSDRYESLFKEVIAEIVANKYSRPRKHFTVHSKLGNILPPPFMQSV